MHTGPPLTVGGPPLAETEASSRRSPWVVGVRGGVGTSTIATALGASEADMSELGAISGPAVVVTGPSVDDTELLLPLVDQCHVRGLQPIVVAVVSDGHGRWPAASRARLGMLRDRVEVVAVPWVGRWRWRGQDEQATAGWLHAIARLANAARPPGHEPIVAPRRPRRRASRRRMQGEAS